MKNLCISFLFFLNLLFNLCKAQNTNELTGKLLNLTGISRGEIVAGPGKNIGCILQDKKGKTWFASNGEGVFRYDGKTFTRYSQKNGLCSDFVWSIQEDVNGNLWFSSRDGICRFNGVSFTDYTSIIKNAPEKKQSVTKAALYFGHHNGLCSYDGEDFSAITLHPKEYQPAPNDQNRPYSVYSTITDKENNVWFGTQEKGVCRYDGKSITWFTEAGLDKAAVRTLFQDSKGNIWAGNNGAGLFRFNGKTFENFTRQKGLENPDFLRKLKGKAGTLARPWTINEDKAGKLWIGTIDAGVWTWDGKNLRNFTEKDGLADNSVWTIFRNNQGELWFVSKGNFIQNFRNGRFSNVEFR